MAMGGVEAAVLALAVLFYAVTIYKVTLIFIGLRLTADRGKPFDKGSLRNPVDLPKVSILIPAKDEEVVIEGAILCANRLDYPKDLLEIIVVEDGSKDETPTIGKRMASLGPGAESCVTQDLDYSLRLARSGGKVGMVDADIWIQPTYRARHLVRQRQRWWGGALQVFWKGLRGRRSGATRLRQRIDTFIYIASPILFLISSILFLSSIVLYGLYGGAMASLMAWIYGIIGTNLILTPLIVGEAVTTRRKKLLWLMPGPFFYWFLQVASFVSIAFRLVLWPKGVAWQRTPKMRVD